MATKDYSAIAKAKIHKAADNTAAPRILVYGRNKKGKTHFGATAPNVLILDPEEGTKYETKLNPDVWPVTQWDDVHEAYEFLKSGKHSYEWVCLDGLTRMANMSLRYVTSRAMERELDRAPETIKIQDYGRSGELVKQMLTNFHSLRTIGMVISAQERMMEVSELGEEDEDAETTTFMYVPDVPKGARSAVNAIVDVIGRIYTVKGDFPQKYRDKDGTVKTRTVSGVQRRLWVAPNVSYDTGYRSEYVLPEYLASPTVPKLVNLIKTGKAA